MSNGFLAHMQISVVWPLLPCFTDQIIFSASGISFTCFGSTSMRYGQAFRQRTAFPAERDQVSIKRHPWALHNCICFPTLHTPDPSTNASRQRRDKTNLLKRTVSFCKSVAFVSNLLCSCSALCMDFLRSSFWLWSLSFLPLYWFFLLYWWVLRFLFST